MTLPDPKQVSERTEIIRSDFVYIYDVVSAPIAAEVATCLTIYSRNVLAEFPLTDKPCSGPWKFILCDVMPDLRLMLLLNTINKTGAKAKPLYLETSSGCAPSNAEQLDFVLMYNLPSNRERFLDSVPIDAEQFHFSPNTTAEFATGCCFVDRTEWMRPKQLDTIAATLGVAVNNLWVEKGEPPFYSEDPSQGRGSLDFEPAFVTSPGVSFSIYGGSQGAAASRKRPAPEPDDDDRASQHETAKRSATRSDAAVTTDDMDQAFRSGRLLQQAASPFRESESDTDGEEFQALPTQAPSLALNSDAAAGGSGAPSESDRAFWKLEPGFFSDGTIQVVGSEFLQVWAQDGPSRKPLPSYAGSRKSSTSSSKNSISDGPVVLINSPIRHWILSPFKADLTDERIKESVASFVDNIDQILVLPYLEPKEVVRKRVIFTERSPMYGEMLECLQNLSNSLGLVDVLSSPRLKFECLLAEQPHPDKFRHPAHSNWVPLSFQSAEALQNDFLLLTNLQLCTNQPLSTYIKTRFAHAECFHVETVKSMAYAVIKFGSHQQCLQTYMAMQFRGGPSTVHHVCQLDYLSMIDGRLRMPSHDFLPWISTKPAAAAPTTATSLPVSGSSRNTESSAGLLPQCKCHPAGEFLRVIHQPSLQNIVARVDDALGSFRICPTRAPTSLVVRTAELLFDPDKAKFDSQASVRDFYAMLGSQDLAHGSINCPEPNASIPGLPYRLKWILTGTLVERKPLPRGKSYRSVSSPIRHWCIANLKQGLTDQRLESAVVKALSRVDQVLIYQLPSNQFGLQKCAVFTELEPSFNEMRSRIVSASAELVGLSNSATSLDYQVRMSEDPNLESSAPIHWVPLSYETAQAMETQFLFVSVFQSSRTSGLVVLNYFTSCLPNALGVHVPCHLDKSLGYAVLRFANWEYCADAYRYVVANESATGVRAKLVCLLDYVEIGDSVLRIPWHNLLPWYEAKTASDSIRSMALLPLDKSGFDCTCHPQSNCLRQFISKDLLPMVSTCAMNWSVTPKKVTSVNQCVIEMLRAKAKQK